MFPAAEPNPTGYRDKIQQIWSVATVAADLYQLAFLYICIHIFDVYLIYISVYILVYIWDIYTHIYVYEVPWVAIAFQDIFIFPTDAGWKKVGDRNHC